MTEKSIRIQNKNIYYTVLGKGAPVLLVHGFAEDGDVWKYQLDELSKRYQLIIPDLPGSGRSDAIEDMSMDGLAVCLKQLIDQEPSFVAGNSAWVTMIGHSMGGYITLAFAAKYPATLRAFGLFHSTAFADSEEKKATRRRGITFIQTHGSYEFIRQSAPNLFTEKYRIKNSAIVAEMMERYSSFDPIVLQAYYEAMIQRPNRTAVLQSFSKPVLFVIGKEDRAIPFHESMKQCHLPETAIIHILENTAHMGMWEEKEKSLQALLDFLQVANIN